jgi:glycosyltransferase involved in cell wall biosynthesis
VEIITNKNFDWKQTNVKLLFLIPNYGRSKYIRKTIDNLINTSIPKDKWIILIINDGIHESFDDLREKNVYYLTLERFPPKERGGAFVRNIAIKYSQSKMIAQRDPEILYTGDFIKGSFDNPGVLYRCGECSYSCGKSDTDLYFDNQISTNELQKRTPGHPITKEYVCWHWGHCAPTECFKQLGGYDEDFNYYGFEDADMWNRLMKSGLKQYFDKNCRPIHLHHPKPDVYGNDKEKYEEMKILYNKKRDTGIIRNVGVNWGEGV